MTDNSTRKIAVTGATGMVGGHLVAELVRRGYGDITLIVRNTSRLSNMHKAFGYMGMEVPEEGITIVESEITDTVSMARILSGIDTVFNCAAMIMSGDMTPQELIDNNVSIARSVVDSSLAAGVRKLIHISSISALGVPTGEGVVIDETFETDSIENDAPYGRSKYYSEKEVWRGAEAGLEVIVVSPGVILGEWDWNAGGSAAIIPVVSSGLPVYTMGIMSYVDVRDVVRAMVDLDSVPQAVGERFILAASDLTYKELITYSAKCADKPRPFIRVGKGMIVVAYGCMKTLISLRLMKDRGVTFRNISSIIRGNRYDGTKITRYCDFEYTPIEDTIERTVIQCKKEKRRKPD